MDFPVTQIHPAAQTPEKHSQGKHNHGLEVRPCPASDEGRSTLGITQHTSQIPSDQMQGKVDQGTLAKSYDPCNDWPTGSDTEWDPRARNVLLHAT